MKYSIKLIGILYTIVSISCLISMWFFEKVKKELTS